MKNRLPQRFTDGLVVKGLSPQFRPILWHWRLLSEDFGLEIVNCDDREQGNGRALRGFDVKPPELGV
jgi:hypothetical protein